MFCRVSGRLSNQKGLYNKCKFNYQYQQITKVIEGLKDKIEVKWQVCFLDTVHITFYQK